MSIRGLGDRWLAGENIPGVAHEMHATVEVVGGPFDGHTGTVTLLMGAGENPPYLVRLEATDSVMRFRQSSLRAVRTRAEQS